jgi:hypothetical protein
MLRRKAHPRPQHLPLDVPSEPQKTSFFPGRLRPTSSQGEGAAPGTAIVWCTIADA